MTTDLPYRRTVKIRKCRTTNMLNVVLIALAVGAWFKSGKDKCHKPVSGFTSSVVRPISRLGHGALDNIYSAQETLI